MIARPYLRNTANPDPRQRAAAEAERQMAYYLECRFRHAPDVHVLHGLRLEDPEQPEPDGSPATCRIDHLLVHRWGMFIVESKSMAGEVRIRPNCPGGDGWSHLYRGRETGTPSPIQQAGRQSRFLRTLLQRSREDVAEPLSTGLRGMVKRKAGADRRDFMQAPMQLAIAVSDYPTMKEIDGWAAAREPSGTIVAKADMLPERLCQELERHRRGIGILSVRALREWCMEPREAANVAGLLAVLHVDPSACSGAPAPHGLRNGTEVACPRPPQVGDAACMHCGARNLAASAGRYGYFWRCGGCGKNTSMPLLCSGCGVKGRRDNAVRIRKQAEKFFRDCDKCGFSEEIWAEGKAAVRAPSTAA